MKKINLFVLIIAILMTFMYINFSHSNSQQTNLSSCAIGFTGRKEIL